MGCMTETQGSQTELGLGVVAVRLCQVPGNDPRECMIREEWCSSCVASIRSMLRPGTVAALIAEYGSLSPPVCSPCEEK